MIPRISASFVFILVFLTLVGHACELPIGLTLAAHAHEDAHDSSDHHADDSQVACDALLAVQPNTQAASNLDVDAQVAAHPVLDTVASHVVVTAPPDSAMGHRGPPLFLLHAALLI